MLAINYDITIHPFLRSSLVESYFNARSLARIKSAMQLFMIVTT